MPIFISYSHENKEFVDVLAKQLVGHGVGVWLDRWELSLGDSIIEKIQTALDGASALLVILSKASVGSEWCKNEINSGLLRELEEKQVLVMPVLLEQCDIPIFVRGKLYADFTSNFDDGLRTVLEGVAKISNENLNRHRGDDFHTDWAIDWGDISGLFSLRMTYIEQANNQPYTVLTVITVLCSFEASDRFNESTSQQDDAEERLRIVGQIRSHIDSIHDIRPLLNDQMEQIESFVVEDSDNGDFYKVSIGVRRLGEDTGRDILVNSSNLIREAHDHMKSVLRTENRV